MEEIELGGGMCGPRDSLCVLAAARIGGHIHHGPLLQASWCLRPADRQAGNMRSASALEINIDNQYIGMLIGILIT